MLRKILKTGFAGCLAAATACTGFTGPAQALPLLTTNPPVTDAYDGNIIRIQRGPKDQYGNPIYPRGPQSGYLGGRGPKDQYGNPVGSNRYQRNNPPQQSNRAQRVDRSQRHHRPPRKGFHRHNGHAYYNGHRGYRHPRRGYRQYNGWWFPLGAFTFGTIIGPGYYYPSYPSRGLSQAHYNWCYRKYRSYRAYDNTFQPYHGPRRACRSPYWP
jgi:hypothetical protein